MATKTKSQSTPRKSATKSDSSGKVLIVLLVAAVVALSGFVFLRSPNEATTALPREISVDQAFQERENGAFILDVREPGEWQEYHIPDATLIPLDELAGRADELPGDRPIVVVCRSGNRSATGREILMQAGFSDVTSMAGGMKAWQSAGYPIDTGQ